MLPSLGCFQGQRPACPAGGAHTQEAAPGLLGVVGSAGNVLLHCQGGGGGGGADGGEADAAAGGGVAAESRAREACGTWSGGGCLAQVWEARRNPLRHWFQVEARSCWSFALGRSVVWEIVETGAEGWRIAETLALRWDLPLGSQPPGLRMAGSPTREAAPADDDDGAAGCLAANDGAQAVPGLRSTWLVTPVGLGNPSRGSAAGKRQPPDVPVGVVQPSGDVQSA